MSTLLFEDFKSNDLSPSHEDSQSQELNQTTFTTPRSFSPAMTTSVSLPSFSIPRQRETTLELLSRDGIIQPEAMDSSNSLRLTTSSFPKSCKYSTHESNILLRALQVRPETTPENFQGWLSWYEVIGFVIPKEFIGVVTLVESLLLNQYESPIDFVSCESSQRKSLLFAYHKFLEDTRKWNGSLSLLKKKLSMSSLSSSGNLQLTPDMKKDFQLNFNELVLKSFWNQFLTLKAPLLKRCRELSLFIDAKK